MAMILFIYFILIIQIVDCISPKMCVNNLQVIETNALSNPASLTIPFGRPYAAHYFGAAFYVTKPFTFSNDKININGQISICALNSSVTIEQMRGACNITLLSRLIGPEILVSYSRSSTITNDESVCIWHIDFNMLSIPGTYEIEVFTWWLNDIVWAQGDMSSRLNAGSFLHLCGFGAFYGHNVYPEVMSTLRSVQGLAVRASSGRALFLFINGTVHAINDMDTFHHIGLGDIVVIEDRVMDSFARGPDVPYKGDPFNGVKPKIPPQTLKHLKHTLSVQVIWTYSTDASRRNCTVHGFPLQINVTSDDLKIISSQYVPTITNSKQDGSQIFLQQSVHQASLPLCTTGDNPGRWIRNPDCDSYPQLSQSLLYLAHAGSECTHSIREAVGPRSMVWRPYSCRLAHYSTCPASDTSCIQATRLTKNDFDNITGHHSAVTRCIREKGIGFVAGFGDSLGNELWKYMRVLFGLNPQNEVEGQGVGDHFLVCGGGRLKYSFHRVHAFGLLDCVRNSVEAMLKKQEKEKVVVDPSVGRTVVVVTNFFLAHLTMGKESREELSNLLQQQGKRHGELAKSLREKHNITYRRILMSMPAKQGFRFLGSSPLRGEVMNDLARQVLVDQHGWEYLDVYNLSYPRPDASWDGLHYGAGAVTAAISDVLMTMLCR